MSRKNKIIASIAGITYGYMVDDNNNHAFQTKNMRIKNIAYSTGVWQ